MVVQAVPDVLDGAGAAAEHAGGLSAGELVADVVQGRGVQGLEDLGQILPALWLEFNPDGHTVSFDTELIWL